MENENSIIKAESHELVLDQGTENYLNPARFDQIHRLAKVFAASDMVPPHFKKTENAFIALQSAFRAKIDPMVALQNMFIVNGRPGTSATLAIALANRSGVFRGPITFEESGTGETFGVDAVATIRETGKETRMRADMKMARAENWTKNSKYSSMPSVMLRYRAATLLIRNTVPEALFGMQTVEEIEDTVAAETPATNDERNEKFAAATGNDPQLPPTKRLAKVLKQAAAATVDVQATQSNQPQATDSKPVQTAYDVINQSLEKNALNDETKKLLTDLLTRELKPQDRMLLPELIRWANTGKPEQLQKLVEARPKTSAPVPPEFDPASELPY